MLIRSSWWRHIWYGCRLFWHGCPCNIWCIWGLIQPSTAGKGPAHLCPKQPSTTCVACRCAPWLGSNPGLSWYECHLKKDASKPNPEYYCVSLIIPRLVLSPQSLYHHHHHHHRLRFPPCYAQVGRFPPINLITNQFWSMIIWSMITKQWQLDLSLKQWKRIEHIRIFYKWKKDSRNVCNIGK